MTAQTNDGAYFTSGRSKNFGKRENGEDNISAPSSFIAKKEKKNGRVRVSYGKGDLLKKV